MTDKQFCKIHKLKLEKSELSYFIASKVVDVIAGMQRTSEPSYHMRTVYKKRIYNKFKLWSDGDITEQGVVNVEVLQ